MSDQSQHVAQIPQAVIIAGSHDPSISPDLKQQAVEYLGKVKALSEETWKACLALYLQGAGAAAPSSVGRDGKEKLPNELRVFCLQVVDDVVGNKPEVMTQQDLFAIHQALMTYVQTEFVEGNCEQNTAFIRNKFSYTLSLCFLQIFPTPVPDFLTPFLSFLSIPANSAQPANPQATLLTLHLLTEIAAEVHDPLLKSARKWTAERNVRDGEIRDRLRTQGEGKIVVDSLLGLIQAGTADSGNKLMQEVAEWSLNAFETWAPWVDINSSVTPTSLSLFQRLINHSVPRFRNSALSVYSIILAKGTKTSGEKLQIIRVLNPMSIIDALEPKTRPQRGTAVEVDDDEASYRAALARLLGVVGLEALKMCEDTAADANVRSEGEKLYLQTLSPLIKFEEDNIDAVFDALSPFLGELMRIYKKARKADEANYQLPAQQSEFFATLLQIFVAQMQWPEDLDWAQASDRDDDEDEDIKAFYERRSRLRNEVDNIAAIDPQLAKNRIVSFVLDVFSRVSSQGPNAVPWQQAELAVYLVFIYGELQRTLIQGKEMFFEIPPEVSNALKERAKERSEREHVNFATVPLTAQGEMLEKAIYSGMLTFPHSAVTSQYMECVSRYIEFFRCKNEHIRPVLEAFVDQRGIHNASLRVRQRVIYLFAKFVKDLRRYIDNAFVPAILNGISDALPIHAVLPEAENQGEDLLLKATSGSQQLDTLVYLYESVGALISLIKTPEEQVSLLQSAFAPLIQELGTAIQRVQAGNQPELIQVLQVHHLIIAIGAIARGFPEINDAPPPTTPAWVTAFEQPSQVVLQTLESFKNYRVIRNATRSALAAVLSVLSTRGTHLVAPFVVNTVNLFEPQELVDFFGFLGMLTHRLKGDIRDILEELLPILFERIYALLAISAAGTDEAVLQSEMKKAYLGFCVTLFADNLQDVLITERNKPRLDTFVSFLLGMVADSSDRGDRSGQKAAVFLLTRSIQAWAAIPGVPTAFITEAAYQNKDGKKQLRGNGVVSDGATTPLSGQTLPGYEAVVYDQIVPTMFSTLMDAKFKIKDGQSALVVYEVASMLRELIAVRGQDSVDFLETRFLPSIGCPQPAIAELMRRLRSEPVKELRKYFSDFMRDWKVTLGLPY